MLETSTVSPTQSRFGSVLREIRDAYGLKQKDLAEIMGMSENFVSLLETGKRGISFTNLDRLCKVLDIRIGELMILAGDEGWWGEDVAANIEPVRDMLWERIGEQGKKRRAEARRQRELEKKQNLSKSNSENS